MAILLGVLASGEGNHRINSRIYHGKILEKVRRNFRMARERNKRHSLNRN
jgi:hypothetical protein